MRGLTSRIWILILVTCLKGCSSGSDSENGQANNPLQGVGQEALAEADVSVLMMGNSHTGSNNLPGLVEKLLEQSLPDQVILVKKATHSGFLESQLNNETTMNLFSSRQWDYVVLQAQPYSQSRRFVYPTDAAETLIRMTKEQQGTAVLFPEWPQKDMMFEGEYVHEIHTGIAQREPACVSPVGMAWNLAFSLEPDIDLHDPDGNHANLKGSFLAAMVIAQTISDYPADLLAPLSGIDVSETEQDFFGMVASQTLADYPACQYLGSGL